MTGEELAAHFQPMISEFDEDFRRLLDTRPLLAHYTSLEVLEKILRDGEIWFSSPLLMNDLEEMRFGMIEGRRIFQTSDAIANLCGTSDRLNIMMRAFDYAFGSFEANHAFDVYVFCLTEHEPNNRDGVLSMWRGYGGQGNGAAVVFNTSFLSEKANSPLIITKVAYNSREDRLQWLRQSVEKYCKPLIGKFVSDDFLPVIAHYIFNMIKIFSLKTKHIGFSEEREWRMIYMPDHDRIGLLKDRIGYALGKRGIEPKLKLKVQPLPLDPPETWTFSSIIDRIIIGPTISSPLTEKSVRRMLETIGRAEFCERVALSSIPLRPS